MNWNHFLKPSRHQSKSSQVTPHTEGWWAQVYTKAATMGPYHSRSSSLYQALPVYKFICSSQQPYEEGITTTQPSPFIFLWGWGARQVFYHWAISPLNLFVNFSLETGSQLSYPGWPQTQEPLALASWVAGITYICHSTPKQEWVKFFKNVRTQTQTTSCWDRTAVSD
jgi:hypothetical protein